MFVTVSYLAKYEWMMLGIVSYMNLWDVCMTIVPNCHTEHMTLYFICALSSYAHTCTCDSTYFDSIKLTMNVNVQKRTTIHIANLLLHHYKFYVPMHVHVSLCSYVWYDARQMFHLS